MEGTHLLAMAASLLGVACTEPKLPEPVSTRPGSRERPPPEAEISTIDIAVKSVSELEAVPLDDADRVAAIFIAKIASSDDPEVLCRFSRLRSLTIRRSYRKPLDISCVFPRLTHLDLRNVDIADAGELPHMPALESLVVNDVTRFPWQALSSWPNLKVLDVSDSTFANENLRLACLLPLERLGVSRTGVTELHCLQSSTTLRELSADRLRLADTDFRRLPASLTRLSVRGVFELDPRWFSHLIELEHLGLDGVVLPDVVHLRFAYLETLTLRSATLRELSIDSKYLELLDASEVPLLERVECTGGCWPVDVRLSGSPRSNWPIGMEYGDAEVVLLDHTVIDDLSPLASATNLRTLSLACTPVDDLAPVANLPKVARLHASGTRISSLPASLLRELTELDVYNSPIRELDGEVVSCKLKEADFSYTPFVDLHRLGVCADLVALRVCGAGPAMQRAVQSSEVLRRSIDDACHAVGFIDACPPVDPATSPPPSTPRPAVR
jgi:Leucine-rich repeat (LRR) protein